MVSSNIYRQLQRQSTETTLAFVLEKRRAPFNLTTRNARCDHRVMVPAAIRLVWMAATAHMRPTGIGLAGTEEPRMQRRTS
jgi:hypothetical protein